MSASTAVVLIVERRETVRAELREGLESDVRVLEADDLRAAWQAGGSEDADLLIGDLRGADTPGPSVYRRLQADPALEATPLLLIVPPAEAKEEPGGTGPLRPESMGPEALRRLVGHLLAEQDAASELPGRKAPLEKRVEAVVEARLSDPDFTVGTLAEAVDLSRRQLTRRMKEKMGTTPAAFIRARRLERAKEHLAAGPDTIRQVAEAVGFASPSAFSKAFREEAGCPPSVYAERHGE